MRILVVDDEPDVVELVRLGFTLQWREIDVLGASNGDEALDTVERERPDIVLLDVGLPGLNGFEVLRQIRAFSDVPILMLATMRWTRSRALSSGLTITSRNRSTTLADGPRQGAAAPHGDAGAGQPGPSSSPASSKSTLRGRGAAAGRAARSHATEYRLLYHLAAMLATCSSTARCWPRCLSTSTMNIRVYPQAPRQIGRCSESPRSSRRTWAGIPIPRASVIRRRQAVRSGRRIAHGRATETGVRRGRARGRLPRPCRPAVAARAYEGSAPPRSLGEGSGAVDGAAHVVRARSRPSGRVQAPLPGRSWRPAERAGLLADLVARARTGTPTLVYAARDEDHNEARVIAEEIERREPAVGCAGPPVGRGHGGLRWNANSTRRRARAFRRATRPASVQSGGTISRRGSGKPKS